jgi:hypothetical protein
MGVDGRMGVDGGIADSTGMGVVVAVTDVQGIVACRSVFGATLQLSRIKCPKHTHPYVLLSSIFLLSLVLPDNPNLPTLKAMLLASHLPPSDSASILQICPDVITVQLGDLHSRLSGRTCSHRPFALGISGGGRVRNREGWRLGVGVGVGELFRAILGKDGRGERIRPFLLGVDTFPDIGFDSGYLMFMFVFVAVLVGRH